MFLELWRVGLFVQNSEVILLGIRAIKRASIVGIARSVTDASTTLVILTIATSLALLIEKLKKIAASEGVIPIAMIKELMITLSSVVIIFAVLVSLEILLSIIWWYEMTKGYDVLSSVTKRRSIVATKLIVKYVTPVAVAVAIAGVVNTIGGFVTALPRLISTSSIELEELLELVQQSPPAVIGVVLMSSSFIMLTTSAVFVGIGFIFIGKYFQNLLIEIAGLLLILSVVLGICLLIPVIGFIVSAIGSTVGILSYVMAFMGLRNVENKFVGS